MKRIIFCVFIFFMTMIIFYGYLSYNENYSTENNKFSNNMEFRNEIQNTELSIQRNIELKDMDYKKILSNKRIAMLGDSLIEGYGNKEGGLDYYLSKKVPNATFVNNSKSGSTITNNTGTDNIIMINQVKTLTGNPDIIFFDGGVNDIIGYEMRFISNDLKKEIGSIDNTNGTVMGDFEEVLLELRSKFPNAKLCYIQICLLDDVTINMLVKQQELKDKIKPRRDEFITQVKLMCEKYKVDYLDLSYKFIATATTYRNEDWLHLNDEGYKLITPYILNFLAKQFE